MKILKFRGENEIEISRILATLMGAKIADVTKRGQSYFSALDRDRQRRGVDWTLGLLEQEKTELGRRMRGYQLDLETVLWRRQEMEEDYAALVAKETALVDDGWRGKEEVDR